MNALLVLAWRPFLDPLNVHDIWWAFLVPLSFGISVVYKAVRMHSLEGYWKQVAIMTVQIVLCMIALGLASFLLIMVYVKYMAN
jgi:hypothetical protein